MSTATLQRPRARHASTTEIPAPDRCPVCAKRHQVGSRPAILCAARIAELAAAEAPARAVAPAATSTATVTLTPEDVELVLSSRAGALVACPWGGVMAVAAVYRTHDVLLTHADVWDWHLDCGRIPERTARALAVDLAWVGADGAVAA